MFRGKTKHEDEEPPTEAPYVKNATAKVPQNWGI